MNWHIYAVLSNKNYINSLIPSQEPLKTTTFAKFDSGLWDCQFFTQEILIQLDPESQREI